AGGGSRCRGPGDPRRRQAGCPRRGTTRPRHRRLRGTCRPGSSAGDRTAGSTRLPGRGRPSGTGPVDRQSAPRPRGGDVRTRPGRPSFSSLRAHPAVKLLLIDVGNTQTVIGRDVDRRLKTWRLSTQAGRTADEYRLLLDSLLGPSLDVFDGAAISSVVPPATVAMREAV